MSENPITLYSKDISVTEIQLDSFLDHFQSRQAQGCLIAELFSENRFETIDNAPNLPVSEILSLRLFDGNRQLYARRITDKLFRVVTDFQIDGWPVADSAQSINHSDRNIMLWGTPLAGSWYYEAQIPNLLKYPDPTNPERMAIRIRQYLDENGMPVWVKFLEPGKWEKSSHEE